MAKVRIQATKMSDARVDYISLVKRPANRSPIKIAKQEHDMRSPFDLSTVFTRKAEKVTPEVVGVVTMKGDTFEGVKALVADAGFKVDEIIEMDDGSVVLKQAESAEGEGTVVRLNDGVALVMKGFRPYAMDMSVGDMSFQDMAAAQGFYPSVSTVLDVVRGSIYGVVEKADSPDSAAVAVSKMFDEAKQYATSMVRGLPTKAFKLENAEAPVTKDEKAAFDLAAFTEVFKGLSDKDKETVLKACKPKDMDKDDGKAPTKKEEAAPAADAKVDPQVGLTLEQVSKAISDAMTASNAELTKKLDGVKAELAESVKKSVDDLSAKVEKADKTAQAAADALAGMTVQGGGSGDHITLTSARKHETGMGGREIDTAYMPRNQRGRRQ